MTTLIEIERDSPAWKAAWQGLADTIRNRALGDGSDVVQYNERFAEAWQYMGAYEVTSSGQPVVAEFRHRAHPCANDQRVYARVVISPSLSPFRGGLYREES